MSNIVWADGNDPQLLAAMSEAREAFPSMLAAMRAETQRYSHAQEGEKEAGLTNDLVEVFLGRPQLGIETSMVKVFVPHPEQSGAGEHIWINAPREADAPNLISGAITVLPSFATGWTEGERATFSKESISDWVLVYGDGRTLGGYTFPILRARMSEQQQASFDRQWGSSLGDPARQCLPQQATEDVTTGITLDVGHYVRSQPWIQKTQKLVWILAIAAILAGCAVPLNRNDAQHLDRIMLVVAVACGLVAVAAFVLRRNTIRRAAEGYESRAVVPGIVISENPLQYVAIANINSGNGRRVYAMKRDTLTALPSHANKVGTCFPCTARFYFLGDDGQYGDFLTEPLAYGTNDIDLLQARLDSIDRAYVVALQKCINANYLPKDDNELKRAS